MTVIATLTIASTSAARGGGGRSVLLLGPLPDHLQQTIYKELSRRGVTVERDSEPRDARAEDAPMKAMTSRVEATLRLAEEQYYRIEHKPMLAALEGELERSSAALVESGRWDLLQRLLLWQGIAFARQQQPSAALEAFSAAVAIGATPPKAGRFPPAVLAMYTQAVQAVSTRGSHSVSLRISPEPATVEIDGREVTDRRATLTVGVHWVRISAIGYATIGKKLTVATATRTLSLSLEPASKTQVARQVAAARANGSLDLTRPHVAAALGRLAGASEVLVVRRERSAAGTLVSFSRIRSADGTLLGRQAELVGSSGGQRATARRAIARLWPQAVDRHQPPRPSPDRPFYKKWWFWTAVGVVAVAGGAVVIMTTADWNDTYRISLVHP